YDDGSLRWRFGLESEAPTNPKRQRRDLPYDDGSLRWRFGLERFTLGRLTSHTNPKRQRRDLVVKIPSLALRVSRSAPASPCPTSTNPKRQRRDPTTRSPSAGAWPQRPVKFGGRFSTKCATPSRKSALAKLAIISSLAAPIASSRVWKSAS